MEQTAVDLVTEIVGIGLEEFPPSLRGRYGNTPPTYKVALLTLAVNRGFKAPCKWQHRIGRNGGCSGFAWLTWLKKRSHRRFTATCRDGVFYVLRLPDEASQ